jgi:hypothetical protein
MNNKYIPPAHMNSPIYKNDTYKNDTYKNDTYKNKNKNKDKDFTMKEELFPTLVSSSILKKGLNNNNMKFSDVWLKTTTIAATAAATTISDDDVGINKELITPGWVFIKKNKQNGTIEYKYGAEVCDRDKEYYRYEQRIDACNLKSRIARLQWDQMRDIDHLGDLSYYYNKPSIKQQLDSARYEQTKYKPKKYNKSNKSSKQNLFTNDTDEIINTSDSDTPEVDHM